MSRKRRRRRERKWVGIVMLLLAIAVAAIALADAMAKENQTVVLPTAVMDIYSAPEVMKNEDREAKETDDTDEKTEAPEDILLINEDNPNTNADRPEHLVIMEDILGDVVLLQIPQGSIDRETAYAARAMFLAAADKVEDRYIITSAYRSSSYQQEQYENYIEDKPYEIVGSVLPAYASEHPTGLAIDILSESHNSADEAFYYTEAGQWLAHNAHRYGFILRYPEDKEDITGVVFEPWHYRYVGVQDATAMYNEGLCLEEYTDRG